MAESIFSRLMGGFRNIFWKKGKKQPSQQQQKEPDKKASPVKTEPKPISFQQAQPKQKIPLQELKPQPKPEIQKHLRQSKPPSSSQIKKSSLDMLLDEIKNSKKQKTPEKEKPKKAVPKPAEKKTVSPRTNSRKKAIGKAPKKKVGGKKSRKIIGKPKATLQQKKKKIGAIAPKQAKSKKFRPTKKKITRPKTAPSTDVAIVGPTTKVELPKNVQESIKQLKQPSIGQAQQQASTSQETIAQQPYSQPPQQQPPPPDIDSEIEATRELMKRLETYYLKRKITDSEFRVKMLEYKEKLFLLNMKKNETEKKGPQTQKERPRSIIEHPHASASQSVSTILREKAKGNIDEGKLKGIEEKLELLMKKYNIPSEEIESKVEGMETAKLIDSFNKLISLLELEKRAEQELNKVHRIQTVTGFKESAKKVEEIKGIATELKKHRIITDFDRVLNLVDDEGRINMGNAAEQLAVPKKRIEECAEILEKDKLIEISYPPIGDAFIQIIDYKDRKKYFDKKKKESLEAKKKLGLIANPEQKTAAAGNLDAKIKLSLIAAKKEEGKEKGAGNA